MTYFNPQGPPALPPARREAARRQLEQIVAGSARSGRWSRPAAIAAMATAVALGTGAAAVAYAEFQPVTVKTQVRCYTAASTSADAYYATIAEPGKNDGHRDVDARGGCSDLWRQGLLRAGAHELSRPANSLVRHPVPPLAVCTMPGGAAAVFPGKQSTTCAQIGLPSSTKR